MENMIEAQSSTPTMGKSTFHRKITPTAAPNTADPMAKYSTQTSYKVYDNIEAVSE
jgi:hypothetical protein